MPLFLLVLLLVVIFVLSDMIRIVPQAHTFIIERLGKFQAVWQPGLHFKIPVIDKVARKINMKELVADFPPKPVITKDNVTMQIDTVIYMQVMDPKLYTYGVERPMSAVENITATTLRNIVGDLELDQTLTSRDLINSKMKVILDEVTDAWGIKINRVELQNIKPPAEIQNSMEKQMKAEREKREKVLRAEGERKSAILVAEGEKEAKILAAQADKEAKILTAEAEKEASIRIAEGQAEAIKIVQDSKAYAIERLNKAAPTHEVLALKSFESFEKVADGKSTKIIVPSDIQNMAGTITALTETVKTGIVRPELSK